LEISFAQFRLSRLVRKNKKPHVAPNALVNKPWISIKQSVNPISKLVKVVDDDTFVPKEDPALASNPCY